MSGSVCNKARAGPSHGGACPPQLLQRIPNIPGELASHLGEKLSFLKWNLAFLRKKIAQLRRDFPGGRQNTVIFGPTNRHGELTSRDAPGLICGRMTNSSGSIGDFLVARSGLGADTTNYVGTVS